MDASEFSTDMWPGHLKQLLQVYRQSHVKLYKNVAMKYLLKAWNLYKLVELSNPFITLFDFQIMILS